MRSATGFYVDVANVDYSQLVARHNTSLVEAEAVLLLGFRLAHKAFVNGRCAENDLVNFILNLLLLLLG